MKSPAVKAIVVTAKCGLILLTQLLWPLGSLSLANAPHAPHGDCAVVHHCGCPAEKTARQQCCCSHGAPQPKTKTGMGQFLSAVHCSGATPSPGVVVAQVDFMIPATDRHVVERLPRKLTLAKLRVIAGRAVEPPDPPPKSFLPS